MRILRLTLNILSFIYVASLGAYEPRYNSETADAFLNSASLIVVGTKIDGDMTFEQFTRAVVKYHDYSPKVLYESWIATRTSDYDKYLIQQVLKGEEVPLSIITVGELSLSPQADLGGEYYLFLQSSKNGYEVDLCAIVPKSLVPFESEISVDKLISYIIDNKLTFCLQK